MLYQIRLDYFSGVKAYRTAAELISDVFGDEYSIKRLPGNWAIVDNYDNTPVFQSKDPDAIDAEIVNMCAKHETESGFYVNKLSAIHDLADYLTKIDDEESIREIIDILAELNRIEEE